jgi:predicted metal-dependent enzyme (double-stranded beta helix superfamily)
VGQKTPVHSHETWGVVGIYSGIEGESRYVKPLVDGEPLVLAESGLEWGPGQVSVCCVRDDDVHMVACVGDAPCVGIHVYGTDIGTLSRRAYDPATGEVRWFISQWEPVAR